MMHEDLFLAIGAVEDSRLARSELTVSSDNEQKERTMKRKPIRYVRNLLIAAVIVSMLAVSAYAVTGFLIFESPEKMVSAIFGDNTGFDHKGVTRVEAVGKPGTFYDTPAFDRVPADETVVAEDIAPYVSAVGQTITDSGYTLTVDAFMYDEATKCGFVTYILENSAGIPYKLQDNGEIWYEGMPDPVEINEYGYPHIIREKSNDIRLAATYYFRNTGMHGDKITLGIHRDEGAVDMEELNAIVEKLDAEVRKKLTPVEAVKEAKALIGDLIFQQASNLPDGMDMTQAEWEAECAYSIIRDKWYEEEYEQKGPSISIPMTGAPLNHATAENGSIVLSPISFQLDTTNLEPSLLGRGEDGMAEVSSIVICFADGTEYIVMDDHVDNTVFRLIDSATAGREDLYNRFTCMFNRIIDVDDIESIILDGNKIRLD